MNTKKHDVPEELLASLLGNYKKPEDLIGENGLRRLGPEGLSPHRQKRRAPYLCARSQSTQEASRPGPRLIDRRARGRVRETVMEIQPSRQHHPDRFGPLSPRIAPGPDGLDRLPVRQQFLPPAAHAIITRDDGIGALPSASQAAWGETPFTVPGRTPTYIVRRARRVRVKLPWWWPWLLAAERIERGLRRWWQGHFQRTPRRYHRHR